MKNLNAKLIVAALIFVIAGNASAQSSEFQTSFFSKDLIKTVLSQRGCTAMRMYPVIDKSSNTKSVLIVGIDVSGNELSSKYQIFTGAQNNKATYSSLGKSEAKSACEAYFSTNEAFVSDISIATVEAFLTGNSLGIAIQRDASQKGNFMISSYVKTEGLKATGGAKPGDPCPNACGEARQYLVFPGSTR